MFTPPPVALSPPRVAGTLTLIIGPMNSGKTTELCDEAARLDALGLPVLYVNSAIDNRNDDELSTHNPLLSYRGKLRHATFTKRHSLADVDVTNYYMVLIDEGHFFPELRRHVERFMAAGCNVCVSALSGDSNRQPFGETLSLIPLCEFANLRLKSAYCVDCAKDRRLSNASFSYRLVTPTDPAGQILVGGTESYATLCAQHYQARTVLATTLAIRATAE